MMRQDLPAMVYFAVLAVLCPGLLAQTEPANPGPTAQSTPDQTAPAELPPASLAAQLAQLVSDPAVSRDHWGIMVTNLDGAQIYGLNQAQLFQPASNAKLFTTTAAMALLGPERRFETKVVAEGTLAKGELHGDLVLRGGGDANFASQLFPYLSPSKRSAQSPDATPPPLAAVGELADQIVAKGVKVIDGDVVGDDSYFAWDPYPQDWAQDDLLWGYGAPVSALTIHDNQIDVTITPRATDSPDASISLRPDLPYYNGARSVRTWEVGDGNSVLFERAPGTKDLSITGRASPKTGPDHEEIAIEDPAEYAALALRTALEMRGVTVKGRVSTRHWDPKNSAPFLPATRQPIPGYLPGNSRFGDLGRFMNSQAVVCSALAVGGQEKILTVLATHLSPPVADDILLTNKTSQNLHAEILLRNIGATHDCEHTARRGVQWVRHYLLYAGLDPKDFIFFDGSGLSGHDLVTPRATAKLLQFATTQPWFAEWKASLPVGGEDGTLASRFPDPSLKDHLFAKTGTLGEARALSGYLDCASGRTVIFSIMVGNHLPGDNSDRVVMDKIVAAIATAE